MTHNVMGFFDTYQSADQAVRHLQTLGYTKDEISIVTQDQRSAGDDELFDDETDDEPVGAGKGAVVGGVTGLLVGLGSLMIPGIGPIVAAGPLAAAIGTGAGAISGAVAAPILDSLMGAGVPREDAEGYMEGIRRGGVLISVEVNEEDVFDVSSVLERYGAADIKDRTAEWTQHEGSMFASSQDDRTGRVRNVDDEPESREIPVINRDEMTGRQGSARVYSREDDIMNERSARPIPRNRSDVDRPGSGRH